MAIHAAQGPAASAAAFRRVARLLPAAASARTIIGACWCHTIPETPKSCFEPTLNRLARPLSRISCPFGWPEQSVATARLLECGIRELPKSRLLAFVIIFY
ncbi:hypothetical protein [Azospirillum sp. TSH100]|uniref:hypothetical protein n=1 Tax=Azospirillum sp. TSH100 TaxID=652764 RepID=UPI0010AA41FD|nr:hypothetical protein [Azospirillum sp. TSH100]QCG92242.1 hypothetical protein E6C72_31130 [Azospirillum sp. TSH100]